MRVARSDHLSCESLKGTDGPASEGESRNGVNETAVPATVAQLDLDLPPGPIGQFHQLLEASTIPLPRLSIPVPLEKELKCAASWPEGTLKATSIASESKLLRAITVPVTGARLAILIPVGPEVAVSDTSAALPEK